MILARGSTPLSRDCSLAGLNPDHSDRRVGTLADERRGVKTAIRHAAAGIAGHYLPDDIASCTCDNAERMILRSCYERKLQGAHEVGRLYCIHADCAKPCSGDVRNRGQIELRAVGPADVYRKSSVLYLGGAHRVGDPAETRRTHVANRAEGLFVGRLLVLATIDRRPLLTPERRQIALVFDKITPDFRTYGFEYESDLARYAEDCAGSRAVSAEGHEVKAGTGSEENQRPLEGRMKLQAHYRTQERSQHSDIQNKAARPDN